MKTNGYDLWQKAKTIIPGGSQLLSKRSERFLPGLWPSYYTKAKGCEVWGVDGKHYYDFAQMGVGACILGYADEDVNRAVINAVNDGSMCTLNCPEEIELAERMVSLHHWSDMARFSRSGGEACSIAIRIGRAASGRDKILFCGYHGWHDWYLSANISNSSSLDGHLLSGLDPLGVPRALKDTAIPFHYNDTKGFNEIVDKYKSEIGVIIIEPLRSTYPQDGFLQNIRKTASEIGAVLIFDEVTSGFRMNLGGVHMTLGVEPDIAVFGKALGNGYPISAIIGRKEVMDASQDTFISSTFWTEKIGFAAALATLKKMESHNVQKDLIWYGELINNGWIRIADKHGIKIHIDGIPPLTHISFKGADPLAIQTLYTQEMLEKGYLLGASVYTTYAYTNEIINKFISDSDPVFGMICNATDTGDVRRLLKGEVIQPGFTRLT